MIGINEWLKIAQSIIYHICKMAIQVFYYQIGKLFYCYTSEIDLSLISIDNAIELILNSIINYYSKSIQIKIIKLKGRIDLKNIFKYILINIIFKTTDMLNG